MGRFASLVDSNEKIEQFKVKYKIPSDVFIRYSNEEEYYTKRETGEVVIPMIAFIEGGMKIPMGTVTRDYLRAFRLAPTQCAPNVFRILGSIDALNEKMNLGLTHHDVNWVYNLHYLSKKEEYYLKSRYPQVRLIQCLPESNKGLKDDFLIVSGNWHDGLPCPTREGTPGEVSFIFCHLLSFYLFLTIFTWITLQIHTQRIVILTSSISGGWIGSYKPRSS